MSLEVDYTMSLEVDYTMSLDVDYTMGLEVYYEFRSIILIFQLRIGPIHDITIFEEVKTLQIQKI